MNPEFRKSRGNRNTNLAPGASQYGSGVKYCVSYPLDDIPMLPA
jgi:hypothetical protein